MAEKRHVLWIGTLKSKFRWAYRYCNPVKLPMDAGMGPVK